MAVCSGPGPHVAKTLIVHGTSGLQFLYVPNPDDSAKERVGCEDPAGMQSSCTSPTVGTGQRVGVPGIISTNKEPTRQVLIAPGDSEPRSPGDGCIGGEARPPVRRKGTLRGRMTAQSRRSTACPHPDGAGTGGTGDIKRKNI